MLEHVHHHVPVTALAFYGNNVIFAGEGHLLRAYDVGTRQLLASLPVFEQQAVHGIILSDADSSQLIVRGSNLFRSVTCRMSAQRDIFLELGVLRRTTDWIFDGSFSPSGVSRDQQLVAFVTAHNALTLTAASVPATERHPGAESLVQPLIPGSNCLLFCAHVQWLSASHCLVASGTAFGEVLLWSATISSDDNGSLFATAQTHYTFSAHEGSVFGVQISSQLTQGEAGCQRALATCSDDRIVKVWDISHLALEIPSLTDLRRATGFRTSGDSEETAPRCFAKAMGHVSRIWHVRFRPDWLDAAEMLHVMSFGEDATNISWRVRPAEEPSRESTNDLEQYRVYCTHAGKHIWAVTLAADGRVVTGGADGAIAVRPINSESPGALEIGRPLLGSFSSAYTFKAYSFVDKDTLLVTTTQGKVLVLKLHAPDIPRVWEIAASLQGLRGYSVVTSISGIGWVAGLDGKVYMYVHEHRRLFQVFDTRHKTAGLFAHSMELPSDPNAIGLLLTSVGAASATLLVLAPAMAMSVNLVPILKQAVQLGLPQGFVVTSFTIAQLEGLGYAVLGSRGGCVAIYDIGSAADTSAGAPVCLLKQTHAKDAVTSLNCAGEDNSSGLLHSTSRDGTHAVHRLRLNDGAWTAELVHQLALPFGPNIEGLTFRPDDHIWIWGFKSKHFIAYDITAQREIITVECGGAHRNWAFQPHAEGGVFVWTQSSKLYQQSQAHLTYSLINPGGHGREIKAVAISPTKQQIVATGAEDTNIKLWTYDEHKGFRCLQTLRKHNTGIQHLQWSLDGRYLFSSGGFEEFSVWRVNPDLPGIGAGVFCQSSHPSSGTSDLRIAGFEVREDHISTSDASESFIVYMAYSDSALELWLYERHSRVWTLVCQGVYSTTCLTHVLTTKAPGQRTMTAATDGHLAMWDTTDNTRTIKWNRRHKVHQSAILSVASCSLPDGSSLVFTGGDDNAIGITRLTIAGSINTLLLPRAHAAAVTGVTIIRTSSDRLTFASVSIDQRLKLWQVGVDTEQPGVDGFNVKCIGNAFTAVADVSSLSGYTLQNAESGVLVAGVGMDLWRGQAG